MLICISGFGALPNLKIMDTEDNIVEQITNRNMVKVLQSGIKVLGLGLDNGQLHIVDFKDRYKNRGIVFEKSEAIVYHKDTDLFIYKDSVCYRLGEIEYYIITCVTPDELCLDVYKINGSIPIGSTIHIRGNSCHCNDFEFDKREVDEKHFRRAVLLGG